MSSFSLKHRLISDDIISKVAQDIATHSPGFAYDRWMSESREARESMTLLSTLEYMAQLLHRDL